jgi:ribonuclease P protein component
VSRLDHLRYSGEIRRVYSGGRRFDGKLMTVFALVNGGPGHRFGITASRKAVGNAVQRNRAKRLVREAFRLNREPLQELKFRYDYVFNARRLLSGEKAQAAVEDLRNIIGRISRSEDQRTKDDPADNLAIVK